MTKAGEPCTSSIYFKSKRNADGVKEFSVQRLNRIAEANEGRRRLGMRQLLVTVRHCLLCRLPFESVGDRLCGCEADEIGGLRDGECG